METRTVKLTQKDRITQYLQRNPSLTETQARDNLGVKNLRARIDELRKSGVKIYTDRSAGGQTAYRIDPTQNAASQASQLPSNDTKSTQSNQLSTDFKEQFVAAIRQVFEEKGLVLGSKSTETPIRQKLNTKNSEITQTIAEDPAIDNQVTKLDAKVNAVSERLQRQVEIVDGLTSVIKKSTENIKRAGDISRNQDVRRNTILIEAARQLRKDLEGVSTAAQITTDNGREKGSRLDKLRNVNLTVKSAKIVVEGTAKLDMLAPQKEPPRMSGIDKNDVTSKSEDSFGGSGSSGGILGGLGALALGAGVLTMMLNDEVKGKITKVLGEVITGATEKLVSDVIVPVSKAAISTIGEAIKENPVVSSFGVGGLASGASRIASSGANMISGVGKIATKLGADGVASSASGMASGAANAARYAKIAARGAPLVGGMIDFGARMYEGQGLGRSGVGAVFSTAGAMGGAATGAAIGSTVPIVGTAIGGILGGVAGGWLGGKVGDGLSDSMFSDEQTYSTGGTGKDIDGNRPPSQMKPEESKEFTFNYLVSQGFTREQAAGILGNIMHETGGFKKFLNPMDRTADGTPKGPSMGIVQWNGPRITDFEKHVGKKPTSASLKEQLDFMLYEMKSSPQYYGLNQLKQAGSAKDAAIIFENKFERPAKSAGSTKSRINYANQVLSEMNNKTATIQSVPKSTAKMEVPKTPSIFTPSAAPLKDVAPLAESMATPTIMMPQISTINAPTTNVSGGSSSSGSQVTTVRDKTNGFVRNADKHTGFNFSR